MTNSATTLTASSSKRPASSNPSTPAAKRARPSNADKAAADADADDADAVDEKNDAENEEDMDDEAKAKAARREARTIRNRESAQRSRNQRKAHLAWLESRVVELEAENRALRAGGSAPSSPSKTRESSPAHSVVSLASDLGIPPEIVSAGGGVNLASVAPPPSDMLEDIKPVIPASPAPVVPEPRMHPMMGAQPQPADVHEENMQLRYRVSLLESIVKQTAAYFSNNTPIDMHMVAASPTPHPMSRTHSRPAPGMDATLSPPLFPTNREPVQSPLRLQTQLDNVRPDAAQPNASVDVSSFVDLLLPKEALRGPAAGEGFLDRLQPGRSGEQTATGNGGSAGRSTGAPQGLDLHIGTVIPAPASVQVMDQAQDRWFSEGQQVVQWDEEMSDLLETLEGQANGVSTVVSGSNVAPSAVAGGEQWAWEAALVEF